MIRQILVRYINATHFGIILFNSNGPGNICRFFFSGFWVDNVSSHRVLEMSWIGCGNNNDYTDILSTNEDKGGIGFSIVETTSTVKLLCL